MKIRHLCYLALLLPSLIQAAEEEDLGFGGSGEFGLVSARGNSTTETLNIGLSGHYTTELWRHRLTAKILNASEGGEDTAKRFELAAQSNYEIGPRSYGFGSFRYQDDEFSQFDAQTSLAVGYGRKVLTGERHTLDAELGAGFRYSELRLEGSSDSEPIVRLQLDYQWQLSEQASLQNELLVESGSDNTFARNITSLNTNVTGNLGLKLGYELRHNSDVSEPNNNTDFLTTVNLIFAF